MIKFILRWIKFLLGFGPYCLYCYFAWMIRYSRHPEKYDYEKRFLKVHKLFVSACKWYKIKVTYYGLENIPSTPSYLVANHQSCVDPVAVSASLNHNFSYVAKQEVRKFPFVGKASIAMGGLFLPREDLKESIKVMLKIQKSLENKEHHWMIFPEGTRNRDNLANCLPFHPGTFRPAMKAKAPIVPVAIYGTYRLFLSKHSINCSPIQVSFLKPLMPEEYENLSTEEVAELMKKRIEDEINFNLIKKDREAVLAINPKYDFYYLGKTK